MKSLKLEELKNYSVKYSHIIKPYLEEDEDIREELKNLKTLDQVVINPFLIGILKDYKEDKLDRKDLLNILKLLQSYIWRRFITEKPSNLLNKLFQGMYLKISKKENYYTATEEILLAQEFPTNEELKESLKTKNVYKNKERLKYVFRKIENYNHNELIDFDNDKITIEHIFPQRPSKTWKELYTDEELEEMKALKNTISNLTLTGSNVKLGNKTFLYKRDQKIHGYRDSKLYLNSYLGKLERWDLQTMKERFEILFNDIIKIWKRPENTQKNLRYFE